MALLDNNAKPYERVWYTPYGEARHHWGQDFDGDRDFDSADTSALLNKISGGSVPITDTANYDVEYDLNRDGTIDFNDLPSGSAQTAVPLGQLGRLDGVNTGPDNWIGYAGYVWEGASSLYHVRFRSYSPSLGRWMQRDPAGYVDGMSPYEYVQSQPIQSVDPLGLFTKSWKRWLLRIGGVALVGVPVGEYVVREVQDVKYDSRELTQDERECIEGLMDLLNQCTDNKYKEDTDRVREYMDSNDLGVAQNMSGLTYGFTQVTVTGYFSKIWISEQTLRIACHKNSIFSNRLIALKTVMHEALHAGSILQSASENAADSYELDMLDDIKEGIEDGKCLCDVSDRSRQQALKDIDHSKEETWGTKAASNK